MVGIFLCLPAKVTIFFLGWVLAKIGDNWLLEQQVTLVLAEYV